MKPTGVVDEIQGRGEESQVYLNSFSESCKINYMVTCPNGSQWYMVYLSKV